jgi:chemotaxis protein CheX
MDVGLVNPFLSATTDILTKVASITFTAQKPFLKTGPAENIGVFGVVTLKGDHTGTAAIGFSNPCILGVVSKMLGEEVTELSDDVRDATGEITNMITGLATQLYEKKGLSIKASLDQVIPGNSPSIPHLPELPVLSVPIQTDMGDIVVEMCFK